MTTTNNTVKETGILFSGAMVRATLRQVDPKTQTRRIANTGLYAVDAQIHGGETAARELAALAKHCPYGQPGDRLWVRETFFAYGRWEARYSEKKQRDEWHFVDMTLECDRVYQYAADNPDVPLAKGRGATPGWWTRPAIFMPRAASRILLEIVSVRVERLNDCSNQDAIAEGIERVENNYGNGPAYCDYRMADPRDTAEWFASPINSYRTLWESINGPGSWGANPFVWAIEFKRVLP